MSLFEKEFLNMPERKECKGWCAKNELQCRTRNYFLNSAALVQCKLSWLLKLIQKQRHSKTSIPLIKENR